MFKILIALMFIVVLSSLYGFLIYTIVDAWVLGDEYSEYPIIVFILCGLIAIFFTVIAWQFYRPWRIFRRKS